MAKELLIKYWWSPNFGDKVNFDLVKWISGVSPTLLRAIDRPGQENYMVIGSILKQADSHTVVWGSGFSNDEQGFIESDAPRRILAVRGPLTRDRVRKLGVGCPELYGDPLLLLPRYYQPRSKVKKYKLGLILHWKDAYVLKNSLVLPPWVVRISWDEEVDRYVDLVNSCEMIASSSLHGLICADAYGIPAIQVEFQPIGQFKFTDYFMSVGRPLMFPLILTENVDVKRIFDSLYPYKIKIDLDKLYSVCPFKKEIYANPV
jgi:pyruvyltransferase